MEKIGLIAGNGSLPYFFFEAASKGNHNVYPIGLFESADERLKKADNYVRMNIGEIGKLVEYLKENEIKKLVMLGKVEKSLIFKDLKLDTNFQMLAARLPDMKDETILFAVISFLKEHGIEMLPQTYLMDKLLVEEKTYTNVSLENEDKKTVEIGIEAAKALSSVDAGQTVIVKENSVVALEAIEGTDQTIRRAGQYAGSECIIVKMSRPQQDMRVDIPAIGLNTIEEAIKIKAKGIVVETGKVLFLDKEEVIKRLNANSMFLVGVNV